ncbi:AAA family ATPase [Desulfuromonas thiophila]|uniref:Uncharacterized domain associated with phage/plasmid primase n=1 Tax=Desulfuromonas thiophila TaxID=57664 RepID=A0A1G7B4P0_9BACT|nr:AAA family ATPase [Desulfuromonas thiophila]SDE21276.1 Uncharacterized domain associated with phage/plasmid primase [Desulfuromonas thiophila]
MIDLSVASQQRREYYRPPAVPDDPVEAFRGAMAEYGLAPDSIDPSGRLVRFDIDKRGDKAGWYVFFLGEVSAGAFGSWKSGDKQNWCQFGPGELTDAQAEEYRRTVERAKKQREEEEARLQAEARVKAGEIWDRAEPAAPDHPYLVKKGVACRDLKTGRGDLIAPLRDADGAIHNVQFIKPGGEKKFLFGGRVEGLSFTIPGDGRVMLCEGVATGASIHAATGATVICAFNAGNLPPVARSFRERCPTTPLTICADNDRFTAGNPGITKAGEAAKATGATLVFPCFDGIPGGDDQALKWSDFNDLAAVAGNDTVALQIKNPGERGRLPPLSPAGSQVGNRLKFRPKPLEFIFKFNDQGLIPRGVIGVLTATGGTGKTFFLLSLAMAGAAGGNFGPIRAPSPVKTLVIVGEDTQDELDRRLWDIGHGQFPEQLHAASVYGELGPLMRLDGSLPVLADTYFWLEQTIKNHPGLELLIIDPKSRFYGLDENNSEHATQWIQALEGLAKRHGLTILFSHHTSKDSAGKISQNMSRGSSAIVDGCRWQGGLVRMDDKMAARLGVERAREYVLFDAPKSNYAADLPGVICFRRGEGGVLEYTEPGREHKEKMAAALIEKITLDPRQYTRLDLVKGGAGDGIAREMKDKFPGFRRAVDMEWMIEKLINEKRLYEVEASDSAIGRPRIVLVAIPF